MLARLMRAPVRPGVLCWIGLRPARRAPLVPVGEAVLAPGLGLEGDRYAGRGGKREVSLIGRADLDAIAAHLGLAEAVPAARLRRNLVVAGINLAALKGRRIAIGAAELLVTGPCDPCSRMEEEFGPGGFHAVRGHGGVTARVVRGGPIRLGDPVARLD